VLDEGTVGKIGERCVMATLRARDRIHTFRMQLAIDRIGALLSRMKARQISETRSKSSRRHKAQGRCPTENAVASSRKKVR
jgi:hypothetical protein